VTGLKWAAPATGTVTSVTGTAPIASSGGATPAISIAAATTAVVGAVQLSDSTSTTSSVLAATPTAVKSAYDLAAAAIPKTLTTTTGDIIYASAANTPARLGIGTASQVLSVSAGVPAWTTPASGGGETLIATATPSGATSLAFSSIPTTYKHLKIVFRDVLQSARDVSWGMRFNSNSSGIYPHQAAYRGSGTFAAGGSETPTLFGANIDVATGVIPPTYDSQIERALGRGEVNIYRYAELERRLVTWTNTGNQGASIQTSWVSGFGSFNETSTAITSIQFIRSSTQTITGTFYLYGVS
jgi:hypothetical protein